MIKKKKKKGILHSEPYLLTDNSYFTAADYIVLQAVNILFFFLHCAWRKHKQHLQIEHADKNQKRFELF